MKAFLFLLVLGTALTVPVATQAWGKRQMAQPIYGADCDGPYKYEDPEHQNYQLDANGDRVVDPAGSDGRCSVTVYVFDDAGNKCYVVKGSNANGISCVRGVGGE
jgi:hypothetical protein